MLPMQDSGGRGQNLGGVAVGLGVVEAGPGPSVTWEVVRWGSQPQARSVCAKMKRWLRAGFRGTPHGAPCLQVSIRSP